MAEPEKPPSPGSAPKATAEQAEVHPKRASDDSTESQEEHGSGKIAVEMLDDASKQATVSRAFDAAMQTFGLQTNLQINNFDGVGRSGPLPHRMAVSERSLGRVRSLWAAPGGYLELWNRVEERMLVITTGGRGYGTHHAATRILDALCDGRVQHLTSGSITDLTTTDVAANTGYLWTDLDPTDDDPRGPHQLDRLAETLESRGSRMIIVAPPGAAWSFMVEEHRCDLTCPPSLDAVLRLHLDAPEDRSAGLLTSPVVVAARERLGGAEQAARLGSALREVLAEQISPEDAIRRAGAVRESTAEWFAALAQREDRALALALAALDGLSLPTVMAGARDLDERIQRAEHPKGRSSIRPFARPARPLFEAVQAGTSKTMLETSYGEVPITRIASQRENFPRDMLTTMWFDFPYLQEVYLGWLGDLVNDNDPYVRERAAVATGILAEGDFDFVRGRVLDDWACNARPEIRRAAGVALRVPAQNTDLGDIVWKMLESWATERKDRIETDDDKLRRMTAAAALGGPVGILDYERALDLIEDHLFEYHASYRYWLTISRAVVELFADGGAAQSTAIVSRLLEWAGTTRLTRVNVAIMTLIGIVGRPVQQDAAGRRMPPVLRAAGADAECLKSIAALWRLALGYRTTTKIATQALRNLAENTADADSDVFVNLICAVPQTPREIRTLTYEVRIWSEEESHPGILDRLHDRLRRIEVAR
ncbi:hypothetical protein [Actinoplanes sp. NPDC051859]|uniref:hypothetical protein n=1 Tax=Actinoplanes sp. NPDC051859 TaxID=3363909 RepID=UPI00379FF828